MEDYALLVTNHFMARMDGERLRTWSVKTWQAWTLIFLSLNHLINCLYLVLFISFFLPSWHFWFFLYFALVLIFSFFFLSKMIKLTLSFSFCNSPFLHRPMLPLLTQTRKAHGDTLHPNALPHSFQWWCVFFLWMDIVYAPGTIGRKMLNVTTITECLRTVGRRVEYHKGNLSRMWPIPWTADVLVDLCGCVKNVCWPLPDATCGSGTGRVCRAGSSSMASSGSAAQLATTALSVPLSGCPDKGREPHDKGS